MNASVAVVPDVDGGFGLDNPFFAASTLPYSAPPFDRIGDGHYQPAIEAGMAEQRREMRAIADDAAAPTFENTIVAMEKTGRLLQRVMAAFNALTGANTNPELERVEREEAPKLAANQDAIYLDSGLFGRVASVYERREAMQLSAEALRLVEIYHQRFVHAGAGLAEAEKERLKRLNEEESALSNEFRSKVLAATREGAYVTDDESALAGLTEEQRSAASRAAKARGLEGWLVPLQNTTQQPSLAMLSKSATRRELFARSLGRTERGDANDTRLVVARLAQLRAEKARLLGFDSYASWKLEDQMAKTWAAAQGFLDALVPETLARARKEAAEIRALMQAGGDGNVGEDELQPWDWKFYAEQVRKAKYDLDEEELRPYFELERVLREGVFYAAQELFGVRFAERTDLPVWHPEVRVFEVQEAEGVPLGLFYCDLFKRDNKNGGAWMSSLVRQSKLMQERPVIYNVANFAKPEVGEAALISFSEVITLFHEFGHALHGMFSECEFPSLSGTAVARDFVEFPSQFNEHWATWPAVFERYARHYRTGAAMPVELAEKMKRAADFNKGYERMELLAAAQLDMQWHRLPAEEALQETGAFEAAALAGKGLAWGSVPPRYRSSYFSHIWGGGYAAGYYAYLWSEMLEDAAVRWFAEHGGMTRQGGERLRRMVLSRGNMQDPAAMFAAWLGAGPGVAGSDSM